MTQALIVETAGAHAIVRFNRPEIRSPLSVFVLAELDRLLDRLAAEGFGGRLVFTGRDDVFASGADLREIAALPAAAARAFALRGQSLMNRIARFDAVAAVNGYCFGGALDLALACRRRVAAPGATFAHPGANLGIITGWGGTQRLPRLVGRGVALEMFFAAKRVDAAEALRIGLVDRISTNPLETALELSTDRENLEL